MNEGRQLPKPGDLIGAKYRVERALGIGGMGAVYEATHRVTAKRFALKLLLPELSMRDDVVKRFIREAQVAGRFQHPNVVEVYDIGEHGESFFMVMELLRGESLSARLEREGKLRLRAACEIIATCCDGVAAAHEAGIIHRDLKPANIFICESRTNPNGVAKVLDFGISKLAAQPGLPKATTTANGTVMGTPFYMAPEQLRSKGVDHRVDIYALGVTLYQLLSGRQPFLADNYPDLVLKIWSERPTPLELLVPGTPIAVSQVVAQAMARDPKQRFANAEAMSRALAPFTAAGESRPSASVAYSSASRAPASSVKSPVPRPQPNAAKRSGAAYANLGKTHRTSTPLASESLASARMARTDKRRVASWVAAACALSAVSYAAWQAFEDAPPAEAELPPAPHAPPSAAAAVAAPIGTREPAKPTAAKRVESAASPTELAPPQAAKPLEPLIHSAPSSAPAPAPTQTPALEADAPEDLAPAPPKRRVAATSPGASPRQSVRVGEAAEFPDLEPVAPVKKPSPSIDRTQF